MLENESPLPIPFENMFALGDAQPQFVGLERSVAENLANDEGLTLRVLEVPIVGRVAPWRADRRANRLNLAVEAGRVIRAAVF